MRSPAIELVSFVLLSDEGKNQTRKSQCTANLIENGWIVDAWRHTPGLEIGDFLHGAAQNLARARLRQPSNRNRKPEGGNRADLFADESNAFALDLTAGALDSGLEHYEAAGHLTLERIGNANHRTFRHVLVCAH